MFDKILPGRFSILKQRHSNPNRKFDPDVRFPTAGELENADRTDFMNAKTIEGTEAGLAALSVWALRKKLMGQ